MTGAPVAPEGGRADGHRAPFTIPELARGVRALGGAGDPLAQACLAPLLAARRTLVGVTDPRRQLVLCDPSTLRRAVGAAIAALAAQRAPDDGAWRRAEEARLEEAAAPLLAALRRLAATAAALRTVLDAPEPPRGPGEPDAWHQWVGAVQGVLRAAGELRAAP